MAGPAMYFQDYATDYIVQKRKKKDIVAYLGDEAAISYTDPSDISILFLLLFL
jgi:hypothetical protein